jgi:His-Xaa-Ser system radical SAM maturase HxsC
MKIFNGTTENVETPIIGLITHNKLSLLRRRKVLVTEEFTAMSKGFAGTITSASSKKKNTLPNIQVSREVLDAFNEGDCVRISKDGIITVIWEKASPTNPLLLTEMCDCRCLMCPQPPKHHDKTLTETCKQILNLVKIENYQTICLTGGEPTLLKEDFFDILKLINKRHPQASVMLLTNGKSFANFDFTKQFVYIKPKKLITCVSLHSDVDEIHDRITGVVGSFYKTAMGLQNLARFRQNIEIRVVVNNINALRLESIATFILRNFPFITHCAFMGMEITGLASDNYETIWIDPYKYRGNLSAAIRVLSRAGMNVSIYNLPLCLIEKKSWNFARQSISGWKNDYLPICAECSVKAKCCGIFTTSGLHQSIYLSPQ